jgi:DNA-binding transcriptional MerR regulator
MIRSLIRLGLLAVVCIVCYNYFFGNTDEKAQSKRIFKGVGSVFSEVRGLVRSERDKFDAGKYDAALGKMQDVIGKLRTHASTTNDANLQKQVAQLEQRKEDLQKQVNAPDANSDNRFQKAGDKAKEYANMAKQLESLTNDIQSLVNTVAPADEQ